MTLHPNAPWAKRATQALAAADPKHLAELTPRELRLLQLRTEGHTLATIAERIDCTPEKAKLIAENAYGIASGKGPRYYR